MSRSEEEEGAFIVIPDPKGQTVRVSDLAPNETSQSAVCVCLYHSGACENLIL